MSSYVGPTVWRNPYFLVAFRVPYAQTTGSLVLALVLSKN